MTGDWRTGMAVEIEPVDERHREIFRRLGELVTAAGEGRGEGDLTRMLTFLNRCVVIHFREERKAQQDARYPDYALHEEEHTKFLRDLEMLKLLLAESLRDREAVVAAGESVSRYLVQHVTRMDRAFADYMRDHSVIRLPEDPRPQVSS